MTIDWNHDLYWIKCKLFFNKCWENLFIISTAVLPCKWLLIVLLNFCAVYNLEIWQIYYFTIKVTANGHDKKNLNKYILNLSKLKNSWFGKVYLKTLRYIIKSKSGWCSLVLTWYPREAFSHRGQVHVREFMHKGVSSGCVKMRSHLSALGKENRNSLTHTQNKSNISHPSPFL